MATGSEATSPSAPSWVKHVAWWGVAGAWELLAWRVSLQLWSWLKQSEKAGYRRSSDGGREREEETERGQLVQGQRPGSGTFSFLSPAAVLPACVTWGGRLCSGPARLPLRGGGESSCDPQGPSFSRVITFSFLDGASPTAATVTGRGQAGAGSTAVLAGSPKWCSPQPALPASPHLLPAGPPRTRRLMEESPPMPITVLQPLLQAPPLCWQRAVSSEGK